MAKKKEDLGLGDAQEEKKAVKPKIKVTHYRKADPYRIDNPEPDTEYAWINTHDSGQHSGALAAGWEPVKVDEYPNLIRGGFKDKTGYYHYRELRLHQVHKTFMTERTAHYLELNRRTADQRGKKVVEAKGIDSQIKVDREKVSRPRLKEED
jgi:hypothetical protein